jgi:tetratricopeptide (TPR) repeat protein
MRKVNKRLFLYLLLGSAALTGGVFLVHYFQSGRVKAALLYQVRRAEDEKRPDKVVQYLGRYLDFDPDDLEERVHLARTLAADSPFPIPKARERAIYNLETVLSRDPDRVELRCLLARLAIDLRRWELAREQLVILEKSDVPDGERERLQARYEEGQEHFAAAEQLYAKHLTLAPNDIDSYARRAYLLRCRLKDPARADQIMDEMIATNDGDPQAYLRRWRYRIEFGLVTKDTLESYGQDVNKALELAPNDLETLLAAAEREWKAERFDASRVYLRQGLSVDPTDYRFYISQAMVEMEAQKPDAAEEALRKGVEAVPSTARFVLLWKLANLQIDEVDLRPEKANEAEKTIKQVVQASAPAGSADYLNGRLQMSRGKFESAAQLLEAARPSLVSPPELVNQINLHLARCYEQLDRLPEQKTAYERVIIRDPLTGEYLKAAGPAKAGLARLALMQQLKSGQMNDVDVIRALAEAGITKAPFAELQLISVEYLVALQKYDDARTLLLEAQKKDPKNIDFTVALAILAARQGKIDEARRLLDVADREFGDKAELRLARMQFLSGYDGTGATAKLAELAQGIDKFSSADQAKLLRGLAEAHQALGDITEAKQYWNRLAQHPRHRQDARVRLLLLDQAMQANDETGVRDALDQIHKIEGDQGTLWRYADAVRHIWLKKRGNKSANLDEARVLLDQVLKTRPDWPAALLALAELEDLRGDHPHAAELYRKGFAGSRRNPLVLTQLMDSGGQRPEQVEQNLLRAVELADDVPETWMAYIEFVAGRDKAKAEKALEDARKALKKLPPEQLALALAPCYEALGKLELAKAQYDFALDKLPKSVTAARMVAGFHMRTGNLKAAQPLLQQIVERKLEVTNDDVTWAKSGLALALVLNHDYQNLPQALALVGLRVEKNGDLVETEEGARDRTVEGLRARARVLSMQTRTQARAKAVGILEDLNRRQALSLDDQFLLAQLHEGLGDWTKAREILVKLSEPQGGNSVYLSYFVHSLLLKGETEDAQRLLTRLETEDPAPPGVVNLGRLVLKAEMLEAHKDGVKAVELLMASARRKDAKPEELLLVVESLGRQKRIKEALDVCEDAWKTCKPEEVGGVCVALLRTGPPDDSLFDRVQKWLLSAIEKQPENAALHLHLADLFDGRRLYLQEEREYRRILQLDPQIAPKDHTIMALNNLAWLLAQRDGKDKPAKAEEARQLIAKALELAGPRPFLLDTSAVVHLALKQSDKALADLALATSEAPKGIHYFHIARAQELVNNTESAAEALKQAKKLGLKRHNLHPIEAAACAQLADELDRP